MSRDIFHQTRLLRAPSNLALNTVREGAATASLGNLCQGLTTLMVKNFFLMSNLNLPSFSVQPFPLVLSLHTLVNSPSPAFLQATQILAGCSKVIPEPSLLQAEQPQLPQPVLTGEVLQPSDHPRGPSHSMTKKTFLPSYSKHIYKWCNWEKWSFPSPISDLHNYNYWVMLLFSQNLYVKTRH